MAVTKLVFVALIIASALTPAVAAVLPEDRAEALYHRYDGGGMTIDGPSVLLRKSAGSNVSFSANYYVDKVSSASVDVLATASPYSEQRDEYSVGMDVLNEKTIMSVGYTKSDENDFDADSVNFSISQDFFGDLTTLTLGVARGWDTVKKRGDDSFSEDVDRRHYKVSLTQVLTKNALLNINYEAITDEGYLNNPYRQVRYVTPEGSGGRGYEYQSEVYPDTRTSNAVSVRTLYYLPYRAALKGEYRYFTDTWEVEAHNFEAAYTHPFESNWVLDVRYRFYTQTKAEFYEDLFPFQDAQNFMARDKELSTFKSNTVGAGITYEFDEKEVGFIERGNIGLYFDHIMFDYDNFRDVTRSGYAVGDEPLYDFSANVTRFFVNIWF